MTRLAYLGPPGTFTEEALLRLPESEGAELVPLGTVPGVVDAVALGEAAAGLVPMLVRAMPTGRLPGKLRQVHQVSKTRQVAVHAEDRVGDDQAPAGAGVVAQQVGQVVGVVVAVDVGARS